MSTSDTSFNIDSLLEDLQTLGTSSSKGNQPSKLSSSPLYLPHPPSTNKSPSMLNPKVKFAVLPESSTNYHQMANQGAAAPSSSSLFLATPASAPAAPLGGEVNIDQLLTMLDSPSLPYRPTSSPGWSFSPEAIRDRIPPFSAFSLASGQEEEGSSSLNNENRNRNASSNEANTQQTLTTITTANSAIPQVGLYTKPSSPVASLPRSLSASSWDEESPPRPSSSSTAATNLPSMRTKGATTNGTGKVLTARPLSLSSIPATTTSATIPASSSSNAGGKIRCCRVVLGGKSCPRGLRASSFSHAACDSLLCLHCNFKVLFFFDMVWMSSVDYLFLRNSMPNVDKVRVRMESRSGAVAYCCQCAWAAVEEAEGERILVAGNSKDPQWICTGH